MEIDFKDYVKEDNFLNLRSNKEILEHDNLEELGSFLRNNPGITKLSLENCDIDSSNIKRLIAPIKESNISNLDISCNKLGAVGAAEIANELSNLTILNISCNKLGAVGAAEIAYTNSRI